MDARDDTHNRCDGLLGSDGRVGFRSGGVVHSGKEDNGDEVCDVKNSAGGQLRDDDPNFGSPEV